MDVAEIEMRRSIMGSHAFSSQFQQQPTPRGGALFKADALSHRYAGGIPRTRVIEHRGPQNAGLFYESTSRTAPTHVITAIDCAAKTGVSNDYSAIVTLASDECDLYVVDVVRERFEFPELVRRIQEVARKYDPSRVYVEEASSGFAIVQQLKHSTGLPVVGIPPKGSKISRAEALTGLFESGRIKLPHSAPWLEAFLSEMLAFPVSRHDDQVDATVLAISMMNALLEDLEETAQFVAQRNNWIAR